MSNGLISPNLLLLALNIAVAAFALSVIGLLVGNAPRRIGMPLQHAQLCVVVILTLLSPVAVGLSYRSGMGMMTLSTAVAEQDHLDEDTLERTAELDPENLLPDRIPTKPLDDKGNLVNQMGSGTIDLSSEIPSIQVGFDRYSIGVSVLQWAGSLLILAWAIIAIWCLARLIRGLVVVRRIQQSLKVSADPRLMAAAKRAFCTAGLHSKTEIFESRLVPAPLTLGWWRSSVVMPHGLADVLSDQQLVSILTHEVAHVVRRDTMIALFQQIAAALFWWNPMLRTVNRQISRMRERLCDDYVVNQYGDGMPLAESIVQVAQWSATQTLSSPFSLALLEDFLDLEDRILRLAEDNRMRLIHLNKTSLVSLGIFCTLLGLGLLLPAVRAQEGFSIPKEKAKSESPSNDENAAVSNPAAAILRGHVHNEGGEPLEAVRIRVSIPSTDTRYIYPGARFQRWETQTDANGNYQIEIPAIANSTPCSIDAMKSGYRLPIETLETALDSYQPKLEPGEISESSMTLRPALYFKGIVVDEEGKPIPDAEINANFSDGNAVERTISGTDGSFELFNFPVTVSNPKTTGWFSVMHRNYISARIDDVYSINPNRRNLLKVVLRTGRKASGTVVDTTGKPVPNLLVKAFPSDALNHKAALTDANGKFELQGLADDARLSAVAFDLQQKIDPWIPITQDVNDLKIRLQPIKAPANLRTYQILGMTIAEATPELIRAYDSYIFGNGQHEDDFRGVFVIDPGSIPDRVERNQFVRPGSIFFSISGASLQNGLASGDAVREFLKQIITNATAREPDGYSLLVAYTLHTFEYSSWVTSIMKISNDEYDELIAMLEKLNSDAR